jgi:putative lipoic acid-binding regulatory protein
MSEDAAKESALKFPCDFPIKVMGRAGDGLRERVVEIVDRHVPALSSDAVTSRLSRHGKYESITAVVPATSQRQLDDIYREISACEAVIMAI